MIVSQRQVSAGSWLYRKARKRLFSPEDLFVDITEGTVRFSDWHECCGSDGRYRYRDDRDRTSVRMAGLWERRAGFWSGVSDP